MNNKATTMPLEEYERLKAMQPELVQVSTVDPYAPEKTGSFWFGVFCGAVVGFLVGMIYLAY